MLGGGGSVSDPFQLLDVGAGTGYRVASTKTLVNPNILTGTVKVLMMFGQSNIGNAGTSGTFDPTNTTKILHINPFDGGLYRLTNPVLGAGGPGTCFAVPLADTLVTDAYADYVVVVNVSVGSTTISQWEAGGNCNHRIGVAFRRAAALGLTPTHCLWQQGESDTAAGTSQASYAASLNSVIATIQGFTAAKIFVARASWISGATGSNVRAAQAASWNGTTVIQGADTDTLDNTYRASQVDFTTSGMNSVAALWAPIIKAY